MREYLTDDDVSSAFRERRASQTVLALIDGRIYKREDGRWRRLDNNSYRSLKEMTSSGPAQD